MYCHMYQNYFVQSLMILVIGTVTMGMLAVKGQYASLEFIKLFPIVDFMELLRILTLSLNTKAEKFES